MRTTAAATMAYSPSPGPTRDTAPRRLAGRSLVAVVGNLARDRIDGGPPQAGGCPVFAALAFRLLGREGQILARCAGTDRELLRAPLATSNHVTLASADTTAAFEHVYDGDVRTSTITSLGDPWEPSTAELLAPEVGWVHVAPLARTDFPPLTLAAFAGGGRLVSLDGQGLVRVAQLGALVEDSAFDRTVLDHVSVLKLSESEATVVAGGHFDEAAARALGVDEIVVTLGERGQTLWLDGAAMHLPASPVRGVETTGAGDAFMVAYAVARSDGAEPVDAARTAGALVERMLTERRDRP